MFQAIGVLAMGVSTGVLLAYVSVYMSGRRGATRPDNTSTPRAPVIEIERQQRLVGGLSRRIRIGTETTNGKRDA